MATCADAHHSPPVDHEDEMSESKPIRMRLPCESCGRLHIDEGDFATKPHHTHQCEACGLVWRPAEQCTVGVMFLWPQAKDATP